ncbi:YceI family protein [Vogesella oryzae]|uniref:YceI family protein n=1 Tax=Vogesella oryzae TaxID=1735285 RepID=UPI001583749E|nr:YceI family protein [Vogesella oryzae]
MIRTALFAALFATAGAAVAAPVNYSVDPTHTFAAYEVNHLGLSLQHGTFTKVNGQLVVDEAAKKGSVDVTIDANSLQTFFGDRDTHLKSEAFFNVAKFPTLTYKSTAVVFKGDKPASVQGNLTLLGVTKPVTLTLARVSKGKNPMTGVETWGANAVATIKRSDFGMKTFVPAISDDVTLNITLEAAQAQ